MPLVHHRGSGGGRPCRTGLPHREIRGASRPGGGTSTPAVVFLARMTMPRPATPFPQPDMVLGGTGGRFG